MSRTGSASSRRSAAAPASAPPTAVHPGAAVSHGGPGLRSRSHRHLSRATALLSSRARRSGARTSAAGAQSIPAPRSSPPSAVGSASGRAPSRPPSARTTRSRVSGTRGPHIAVDMSETGGAPNIPLALSVPSMDCSGCETRIRKALATLPVSDVMASALRKKVTLLRSEGTPIAQIVESVKKAGYGATQIPIDTVDLLLRVPNAQLDRFTTFGNSLEGVESVVPYNNGWVQNLKGLMLKSFGRGENLATVLLTYSPSKAKARAIKESFIDNDFRFDLGPHLADRTLVAEKKQGLRLFWDMILSICLTLPVLLFTWAPLPPHPREYAIASAVLASVNQIYAGSRFYVAAFTTLIHFKRVEEEMLIVLSTTAAYGYSIVAFAYEMMQRPLDTPSFFETSTLLVTLVMIAQFISTYTKRRAHEAVSIGSKHLPNTFTHTKGDNSLETLDVRLMHKGDIFRVDPGEKIVTDGVIVSGQTKIDEAMLTGEDRLVEKGHGDRISAGTLNCGTAIDVEATRLPGNNSISDMEHAIEEADKHKPHIQNVVDRFSRWFVPVALVVAVITFAVWTAVGIAVREQPAKKAVPDALTYAISVLAVACPCAIVLAVPMVDLFALGVGMKLGIVLKRATALERARRVDHVVFDKTGTLTDVCVGEHQHVTDVLSGPRSEAAVAAVVFALVKKSGHPVSRAVARRCLDILKGGGGTRRASPRGTLAASLSSSLSRRLPSARGGTIDSRQSSRSGVSRRPVDVASPHHISKSVDELYARWVISQGQTVQPAPGSRPASMRPPHSLASHQSSQRRPARGSTPSHRSISSHRSSRSYSSSRYTGGSVKIRGMSRSVLSFKEIQAKGIKGRYHDQVLQGGDPEWLELTAHEEVQAMKLRGYDKVFCVQLGDQLIAVYGLTQDIRPEAQEVINKLREQRIDISILSGDRDDIVQRIADHLNVADREGECTYREKSERVKTLMSNGRTVLFCGDGLNDNAALAQADVGVHMDNRQAEGVAGVTADVVLTNGSLRGLLVLMELSRAVRWRINVNLAWSIAYNFIAITYAAGAWVKTRLPPAYAGLGEAISVVPVVMVAWQLKWFKSSNVPSQSSYDVPAVQGRISKIFGLLRKLKPSARQSSAA